MRAQVKDFNSGDCGGEFELSTGAGGDCDRL